MLELSIQLKKIKKVNPFEKQMKLIFLHKKMNVNITFKFQQISETRNREIRPFIKLNDQIQKILVVNRPYKAMMDEEGFITIGASEFLLNFIK